LFLPKDNLTVRELLATPLVKGTYTLIFKPPENSYHHLAPNQDDTPRGPRTLQNLELTPRGHKGGVLALKKKGTEIETDNEDD
jgi:hypothetical protein